MNKYLIKIKCDKQGLAEILAAAIDSEANIEIDYEAIKENTPTIVRENVDVPPPLTTAPDFDCSYKHPTKKQGKTSVKKITSWELYKILLDHFPNNAHQQVHFKTGEAYDLQLDYGFSGTRNAISAHLSRMATVGVTKRTGGNPHRGGYTYVLNARKNKKDFLRLISRYENVAKAKERKRSQDQNRWYNLGLLQKEMSQ